MLRTDGDIGTSAFPAIPIAAARRRGATGFLASVRDTANRLASLSETQLRETTTALRARVVQEGPDHPPVQVESFALVCDAIRRVHAIRLYDVQLLSARILAAGRVAEMQTGEGKSLACAPAAFVLGLTGRGVHVATPNAYLAQRDCELLSDTFRLLGSSVASLPEQASPELKRAAYRCDVTYATGYELGFDYLRDQLSLRLASERRLGQRLWSKVCGDDTQPCDAIQRPLHCAIVDEIDNVLLDDAGSPLVLSGTADGEVVDGEAHRLAHRLTERLVIDEHYRFDASIGSVHLTDAGIDRVHADDVDVPIPVLLRAWTEYIEKALLASLLFRRDVHYVVNDGVVQIVDASTGRIFSDRSWQDGLHQAIEAKEGVRITAEKQALAQITRQRFFRQYERLCGMTGTAVGCEREFRQVYGLRCEAVALRVPSRRTVLPPRFFANATAKWRAIAESVVATRVHLRPILVGTRSIDDSYRLAEEFQRHSLSFTLLNGRQDAGEAGIVRRAGEKGAITIATNLAGRGTDIQLTDAVASLGGLHVIVAQCHDSARVDRQLIGRGARQGDPGSAQTFVSADDSLIQRFGPWLAQAMRRHADQDGEVPLNLIRQVRRLQRRAERQEYAARSALLRRDLSRDVLFSQQDV